MDNGGNKNAIPLKSTIKIGVLFPIFSALIIAAMCICVQSYKHLVYEVFINGKSVGYVKESSTYNAAIDAIVQTDGQEVAGAIRLQRKVVFENINEPAMTESLAKVNTSVLANEKQYINSKSIESMARSILDLKEPAAALCVNGTCLAVVSDSAAADQVIQGILAYYTPSDSSSQVISVTIKDNIEVNEVYEYTNNIVSCDSAIGKIVAGVASPKKYVIQSGDTIWDIAMSSGISVSDIQSLNPELDINRIRIGDEIYLSSIVPYVNVETVADITSQETIPYDTTKKYDSNLIKGQTKVLTKGESGLKQVVIKTTQVNGFTTNQEVLNSTVLKEAVNQVVAVGTKVVYSTASRGSSTVSTSGFIRPAPGILTSNYGYRGREFHTGVDLAASTGTPVVASKAGTVVFSGWNGNLGYCIIIDHGNGVQTVYGHNSKLIAGVGASVSQGETIALMGSTGRSSGPHCHFEVRVNGVSQNPWNFIN